MGRDRRPGGPARSGSTPPVSLSARPPFAQGGLATPPPAARSLLDSPHPRRGSARRATSPSVVRPEPAGAAGAVAGRAYRRRREIRERPGSSPARAGPSGPADEEEGETMPRQASHDGRRRAAFDAIAVVGTRSTTVATCHSPVRWNGPRKSPASAHAKDAAGEEDQRHALAWRHRRDRMVMGAEGGSGGDR
jgi:hypothetical protein